MAINLNNTKNKAYNYLQTAWLGESPTCNLSYAARRVLDPSIYRYSLLGRTALALRGLTMTIPLVRKFSDLATNYLIKNSFICDPDVKLTAPPRIDREYRQFTDATVVANKLNKERLLAIQEGETQVKSLSQFAGVIQGSLILPLDKTRPGVARGGCSEEVTLYHKGHHIKVNTTYMQGDRPTMEDEHIAKVFQIHHGGRTHSVSLFGIFDGHSGSATSAFVKQNLIHALKYYLEREPLSDTAIFNALKLAFVDLDHRFSGTSGTCASIALIIDGNLWVSNTGDSRVVLGNEGHAEQLSRDAKPGRKSFLNHIKKRGGDIWTATPTSRTLRVNGNLAVGSTIGDHTILGKDGYGCITPRPKITKIPLKNIRKNSRLIIGCDGLWDVATSKEVVEAKKCAESLARAAFRAGSTDNISVMTVDLSGIL